MASSEKYSRSNKNQNIQVFVRLRPLNNRERAIRSLGVVEVTNNREVIVKQSQQTSLTKKFTFDRAFGPNTDQVEVYKDVVSPLIAEVLAGYNCTVFAYGQTGTGKTHTMVGESSGESTTWQNDPLAGIIPRALSQLFDELRISNAEYTVRVSYLELYNEELFDLLASSEDNSKLRIYEDVTRKGSTIVNGLEEITVYNKNEVYQIMAQGQERKKVASTLMNAQSSRSHTVFTIVVHMKENCPKGEELVKIGKLNLVDLAGSENISKAGSDNPAKKERARECVNINQSLLTLGRVITALVEKHPHIPYRESKLTRILQESLGGRTKTSIIATISPGHKDLEETMSTLEYAHRAKNIQNKPEINQKLTKQAILKDFAEEIDKLKRELTCTREKNGVYLPSEAYIEMTLKHDEQRREIQELLLKKRAMEEERVKIETVFAELETQHQHTQQDLSQTREQLQQTHEHLLSAEQQRLEQQHLVSARADTERHLTVQAQQLVRVADAASRDLGTLHDAVDRRRTVECTNQEVLDAYRAESAGARDQLARDVDGSEAHFAQIRDRMQADIDDHARDASMSQETNIQDMKLLVATLEGFMNEIKSVSTESCNSVSGAGEACLSAVTSAGEARHAALCAALQRLVAALAAGAARAREADVPATVTKCTDKWLSDALGRVQCLQSAARAHAAGRAALGARREDAARAHHARRRAAHHARADCIQRALHELDKDKKAIEERITRHQALMESERQETEQRLQNWVEEERLLMEERLSRHVASERNALNARLEQYNAELEMQRKLLEEATDRCAKMQQLQLETSEEELRAANEYLEQCDQDKAECLKLAENFTKEFGEDAHAVSVELEAFSRSVVHVVEHATDQLLAELDDTHKQIQESAESVVAQDSEATQKSVEATKVAVAAVTDVVHGSMQTIVDKATGATSTSSGRLEEMRERTCRLATSALAHQSSVTSSLSAAHAAHQQLAAAARRALHTHQDIEGRYLMKEYTVYTPTGNTPARREFRYPRRLAATSPHERILARFRAQQRPRISAAHADSPDSDCIVVESDEGRQTSDSDASESSVSEDSAVAMQ